MSMTPTPWVPKPPVVLLVVVSPVVNGEPVTAAKAGTPAATFVV